MSNLHKTECTPKNHSSILLRSKERLPHRPILTQVWHKHAMYYPTAAKPITSVALFSIFGGAERRMRTHKRPECG